jgi:ATP-dependent helicase/DNAse subunit B
LWKRVLDILANHKKDIFVIFWMEEDCITPEKEKIKLFNYQKTLQQKLKWLTNTNNIRIYSKLNYPKDFHFNTEFV